MTPDTEAAKVSAESPEAPKKTSYAQYQISGDMSVTMMYAEEALRDYNADAEAGLCPPLFFQDDKLVLVSPDDEGNLTVKPVPAEMLTLLLTRCGTWSGGKRATKEQGGYPPMDIVKTIHTAGYDRLNSSENLPPAVPILKGIHTGVLLDKDWNIIHTKGYNAKTKLYLTKDYEIDPIPETVTDDDVQAARNLLWTIYQEFLFSDAALKEESVHYQNTIAALASAVIRPFWEGVLPIFVTDKSNSGTGGSLLQESTAIAAYGCSKDTLYKIGFRDKGIGPEYEKTLTSAIKDRRTYIIIDNVPRGGVWALELILSHVTGSGNVVIRILGKSKDIILGPSTFYMVNGINLKISPVDITRRIIPVRIVSKKSLSELNGHFKRTKEQLYRYAEEMHPQVIRAFAIFRKNWIQKGKPLPKQCSGNISEYQTWYNEICGMLSAAGYTKILDNLGEIQTVDNEDEVQAADLITALKNLDYPDYGFTAGEILDEINREILNCKPVRDFNGKEVLGPGIDDQPVLPYLDDDIQQLALSGKLTPAKIGRDVLKPMLESKYSGCNYVLKFHRYSGKNRWYLEDVLKQEKLTP